MSSVIAVTESFSGTASYDQTFTVPAGSNYYLNKIVIYAGSGTGTSEGVPLKISLYDQGTLTAPYPTTITANTDLFGNGEGLPITYTSQTAGLLEFELSAEDCAYLVGGHMYSFEISATSGTTPIYLYRSGSDTYSGGALYRGRSYINGNNARDMAMAVYATPTSDPIPPTSCTIDGATTYQTIDGFGAGAVFTYAGQEPLHQEWVDQAYGRNGNQFGLTILRIRIDPNRNWADALTDGQMVTEYGAKILASPWTPPAAWKNTGSATSENDDYLLPEYYDDWAAYLNEFAAYMEDGGAPLTVISLQNEPDMSVDYEGCRWTAAQIATFCKENAGVITVPFMVAESATYNLSYSDAALNDPDAAANIDYVGVHFYGATLKDYPLATNQGKPLWMTEFLLNDQTMDSALSTAQQVVTSLDDGFSAYIWWKVIGTANGFIDNDGVPQKRGYVFGQFSRFARPGDVYLDVDRNTSTLNISAFRDPASDRFAIVVVNASSEDITHTFTLSGLPEVDYVKPWQTNENDSLDMLPDLAVTDDEFTYTVPAKTVITFVGNPETGDYNPALWYAPYDTDENARINSEWFGSFWDMGSQVLYHHDLQWAYYTVDQGWLFLYAYNGLGWIATNTGSFPYVYLYEVPSVDGQSTESGWVYVGESDDGTTWLYFFDGSRSLSGTIEGCPGWWQF
jgi:glucuronoarabinoxylan endo-1,4-beta-xylanase